MNHWIFLRNFVLLYVNGSQGLFSFVSRGTGRRGVMQGYVGLYRAMYGYVEQL